MVPPRTLALLVLLVLSIVGWTQDLASINAQDAATARIRIGDVVTIYVAGAESYGGDFTVLNDGSINGRFGRLIVKDKTLAEATEQIRTALKKYIIEPEISVAIKTQRTEVVYVLSARATQSGVFPLVPGMDLSQLVAQIKFEEDPDELEATLSRPGQPPTDVDLTKLMRGGADAMNVKLEANDLLTIMPKEYVRIWVTGRVLKPGEIRLPKGTDVYRAVAAAGGIAPDAGEAASPTADSDMHISVRRGPEFINAPFRQEPNVKPLTVQTGDTVIVQSAPRIRVTIAGEVERPGEYVVRQGSVINAAIAKAGEVRATGTLQDVLVVRRDEVFKVNASSIGGGVAPTFAVQDGDLIYVGRNERLVLVLGEVKKPGRYPIPDTRELRATDALALAEGLLPDGTLRRVFLARAGKDGRMMVVQFNLDEFIKSGVLASNPVLQSGDIVLFGEIKGINITNLAQFLSSALILDTLLRRR